MIDSGKTLDGKKLEYEILETGYQIYIDGNLLIKWRDPFGNSENRDYEQLALERINSIATAPNPEPTKEEQFRADLDYLAVMVGVEL